MNHSCKLDHLHRCRGFNYAIIAIQYSPFNTDRRVDFARSYTDLQERKVAEDMSIVYQDRKKDGYASRRGRKIKDVVTIWLILKRTGGVWFWIVIEGEVWERLLPSSGM